MGKKRIPQQTQEEVLKETATLETAMKKPAEEKEPAAKGASAVPKARAIKKGQAHIQATYNNTIITITDDKGNVLAWSSSGALGFKGVKKATPFAASRVAEAVAEKVKKYGLAEIFVFVKGVGSGRESAIRALANHGLNVVFIKDITGVPHNGCRPPKVRRV
ncbi:MAG: 30S ribosomal protein S11 [Patescibacteria group bacterium]